MKFARVLHVMVPGHQREAEEAPVGAFLACHIPNSPRILAFASQYVTFFLKFQMYDERTK